MLLAQKTATSFWAGPAYTVLHADTEIGLIEMFSGRGPDGQHANVRVRDRSFQCRVDTKGRSYQSGVLTRWLMSEGDVTVHGARSVPVGSRIAYRVTYQICGDDQLQMRVKGYFSSTFVIAGGPDQVPMGDIHWNSRGQAVLDTSVELPESLGVFLLWIFAEVDERATSSL
jgi:hypothetical protein